MLRSENKKIIMDEYDYGMSLPFKLSGNVLSSDTIVFVIKKHLYKDKEVLKKEYTNLVEEDGKLVFDLCFTEDESKKLPVGHYVYLIRQCRGGHELHNTIENNGEFEVRKGLGV